MSLLIKPEDINNGTPNVYEYDKHPDVCPLCFRHIQPKQRISSFSNVFTEGSRIQIIYRCTNENCDRFFIASYHKHSAAVNKYFLKNLSPRGYQSTQFVETIEKLSPSFIKIYNQALAAESSELEQIAGMGLRKALEFLIKDFAIHQNPNDAEKIKATPLGAVIKKYINDINLKSTAERAVWLGNDETHYVREWADKDINDLKLLIRLSTNWIENVSLTEQYSADMTK